MKKILYLCLMLLTGVNMMAQININDGWTVVLDEEFIGTGRRWGADYKERRPSTIPADSVWKCKWQVNCSELTEGVTKKGLYQAYQRSNTLFNSASLNDNKMRLVAQRVSNTPLICNGSYPTGYEIPQNTWHHCDTVPYLIYYYSGNIQSKDKYHYGYYEIECAIPVHDGIHTSFWLFGGLKDTVNGIKYYEEIDIMEYSEGDSNGYDPHVYSSGIWYRRQGINDSLPLEHLGYDRFHIAQTEPDIRQMHAYGCEWMPDHITFYRDGKVIHEFHDIDHLPCYPKYIKAGYAIDNYALASNWNGPDTLTINNIKVFKLNTDCNTDVQVQTIQQFNQINSMKRSVTIGNSNGITLPSTTNKTVRASDHIVINGPFEIAAGAQLTLMVHECPDCTNKSDNIIQPTTKNNKKK